MAVDPNDKTLDPFTRGHAALWRALLASTAWVNLVKPGNQINKLMDGGIRQRAKGGRAPADYSEFAIDQGGFLLLPRKNSKSVGFSQTYVLSASTGVIELNDLNELLWVTFCALVKSGDDLGCPGLIDATRPRNGTDRPNAPPAPGVPARSGYVAIWPVDLDMYVPLDQIAAVANP